MTREPDRDPFGGTKFFECPKKIRALAFWFSRLNASIFYSRMALSIRSRVLAQTVAKRRGAASVRIFFFAFLFYFSIFPSPSHFPPPDLLFPFSIPL
jgi:hypothetical protein